MADLTPAPLPAAPPAEPAAAAEGYRPLSLLALVGFVLAALFAASVLVGGLAAFAARYPKFAVVLAAAAAAGGWSAAAARRRSGATVLVWAAIGLGLAITLVGLGSLVAFSGTSPWLLPDAIWLLVAAALLTCWLALSRIAAAEGTLGGASLAKWGVGLTLFFALNYGAYRLSTTFAVRSQARFCTDTFLDLLRHGEPQAAFLYTVPTNRRPQGGDLRRIIEVEHNVGGAAGRGAYSLFSNASFVQQLMLAGKEAKLEPVGFSTTFEKRAYYSTVTYKVTTPLASFVLDVTAVGQEGAEGAAIRRQWHVEMGQSGIHTNSEVLTSEGELMKAADGPTRLLVRDWVALAGGTTPTEPIC